MDFLSFFAGGAGTVGVVGQGGALHWQMRCHCLRVVHAVREILKNAPEQSQNSCTFRFRLRFTPLCFTFWHLLPVNC